MIEALLAHQDRNKVRAAYNRAEYLKDRRDVLQSWADYLDSLNVSIDKEEPEDLEGRKSLLSEIS